MTDGFLSCRSGVDSLQRDRDFDEFLLLGFRHHLLRELEERRNIDEFRRSWRCVFSPATLDSLHLRNWKPVVLGKLHQVLDVPKHSPISFVIAAIGSSGWRPMFHAPRVTATVAFLSANIPTEPRHEIADIGSDVFMRRVNQYRNTFAFSTLVNVAKQLELTRTKRNKAFIACDLFSRFQMFQWNGCENSKLAHEGLSARSNRRFRLNWMAFWSKGGSRSSSAPLT